MINTTNMIISNIVHIIHRSWNPNSSVIRKYEILFTKAVHPHHALVKVSLLNELLYLKRIPNIRRKPTSDFIKLQENVSQILSFKELVILNNTAAKLNI